ncbi:hypothetical protein GCM10022243_49230 [Saccharothrix violaceirubra]|uniref:Uncharacterized protein n=1 Tax=Saccharothrix violaceirubra TaxID=413306 RepID=A0A7W7SZB4_9PSEU|nr:hypothetical protein [Saccharothrix violaceirubra]MBB4963733.1 hypothetical protein [Saccharothrix violaceirubra]
MSVRTVFRYLCDAPRCPVSATGESASSTPAGWSRLSSTAHLAGVRETRGTVSPSDRARGSFSLLLCPDHAQAFDGHRPVTDGRPPRPGRGAVAVHVACTCGGLSTYADAATVAGDTGGVPAHLPERAWWLHLPVALRWYTTREMP